MATEIVLGEYLLSDDRSRIHLPTVFSFLARSYWAASRPQNAIERSVQGSRSFGLYDGDRQIAFARLVTDYATVFYLADVFVDEEYRGGGLGKQFVETILSLPDLEGFVGILATRDAHSLYERYGFAHEPDIFMRRPSTRGAFQAE